MIRLFRYVTTLFLLLTVAVTSVRAISLRPYTALASLFTNADGTNCEAPCIFGIQVGKVSKEQALQIIRQNPLTADLFITEHGRVVGEKLVIDITALNNITHGLNAWTVSADDNLWGVNEQLSDKFLGITLWEMIVTLGIPDFIRHIEDNVFPKNMLCYKQYSLCAYFDPAWGELFISPNQRLSSITVYSEPEYVPPQEDYLARPWKGFVSLDRLYR